jgi:pimeloyl-ACP methyl ester carboxylesterase
LIGVDIAQSGNALALIGNKHNPYPALGGYEIAPRCSHKSRLPSAASRLAAKPRDVTHDDDAHETISSFKRHLSVLAMPQATANGLSLEYETFGKPENPAILLIMGLGAQLTLWPENFCRALAKAGYYVIRYDNRDVGLSSKLDSHHKPRLVRAGLAYKLGLRVRASYTLDDMAQDAVGLLDALGIRRAHVIGASMGGMIGQILGAKYGERLRSLVLVMTNSGHPRLPGPSLKISLRLVKRPKRHDRETLIQHAFETWQMIGSPGYPVPDAERLERISQHFDRAHHPRGLARQTLAIFASGDRSTLLPNITTPTLIVHGEDDLLVPVAAAYDLAKRIPQSTLNVIPGMGHDLPDPLIPTIAASVLHHIRAAERTHKTRTQRSERRPHPGPAPNEASRLSAP